MVPSHIPEIYGAYEGETDSQYVGCVGCGDLVDVFEPHPMFREEGVSVVGDATTRTYHFCSTDCLERWTHERDFGE